MGMFWSGICYFMFLLRRILYNSQSHHITGKRKVERKGRENCDQVYATQTGRKSAVFEVTTLDFNFLGESATNTHTGPRSDSG